MFKGPNGETEAGHDFEMKCLNCRERWGLHIGTNCPPKIVGLKPKKTVKEWKICKK